MTDLEKLITELLDLPSIDLEGNENINVRYVTLRSNEPFVLLEGVESIYLHPTQALALLDWLKEQRGNLEELQEALRAQQIQDASTKEQRDAERLNALKARHSEAVTAWQSGGCVGPCPSFEEIAKVTVVPDSKASLGYHCGDIGQPLKPHSDAWMLCCPGCGYLSNIGLGRIAKHDDGTVSSTQPLHCHGSKARQRYSIEHNEVRWL